MLAPFSLDTFDRIGLFLDVDGTLIDIAPRPDEVVVPSELLTALAVLNDRLDGALALVSGRSIADLDGLFKPLRLRASGVHGAEFRFSPNDAIANSSEDALPEVIVRAAAVLAESVPGTLFEDKRFSVAIHYRHVPHLGPALGDALDRILQAEQAQGLRILPGHMVYEIKRSRFDKGRAVRTFMGMQPFLGRRPVFMGDDITDQPGFDVATADGGFAFSIGHAYPGVSGSFPDPAAVRSWLTEWASTETHRA